jgi:hypothetical protein
MDRYAASRKDAYVLGIRLSKQRRVFLGPYATVDFLCYDQMWIQVHEMLYAETQKGQEPTEEQIQHELDAYNSLIPKGDNVPFTVFFEIDNPARRKDFLSKLAGVEAHFVLQDCGKRARDVQTEVEEYKTDAEGKTSSVHFLSFDTLQAKDLHPGSAFVCDHPAYSHSVRIHDELLNLLRTQLKS